MQHVEIQTAQNVALQYQIAGVGDRILAYIIDALIVGAYYLLSWLLLAGLVAAGMSEAAVVVVFFLLILLPALFYHLVCEVFLNGQSLGKKARKIRVMRLDGREPTLGNYVLRWLLRLVDIGLASGLVGLLCILMTKHSQRLGDLAAGTTVVSLAKRRDLRETIFARTESTHQVRFPQVDRLTDEDIQLTKETYNLLVLEGRTPRARQVGDSLKRGLETRMGVTTDLTPLELARTVLRDYNHLHGVVE